MSRYHLLISNRSIVLPFRMNKFIIIKKHLYYLRTSMTEELGNYETSFFIMNVPTKADLEIRDMADEDFAIFFHEYIHFLQDITSFYGYMGIYSHGEYMRRAINDIYVGPRRFNVPLEFEERGDFVAINKRIASLSLGDKEELNFVIIKDVFIETIVR